MAGLWSLGEAQLARRALLSRWTAEAIGVARHVRRGLGAQGKAAASADAAVSRRGQSGVRHVAPVGRLLHQDRRQYQRRGRRPMIGEGPCAQHHTEQRDDTCSHLVTMPRVPCSHHTGQLRRDANTWQRAGAAIPLSQTRRLHSPPPRGNCRPSLLRQISATVAEKEATAQAELPKNFDFSNEERLYKWWESNGYFKPAEDSKERPFTMAMPPPNVTGALHMGHAMFVTLQDILARFHRMNGSPTLWLPGTDHAGIATQLVVEKMLATQGIKRTDLQREDFEKKVWEWKEKYGGTITNQMRRLGASCDWSRERFTLDENLSQLDTNGGHHLITDAYLLGKSRSWV
ncbi:hypothetical protein CBR_g4483 [Chara braunii]|uniref:valine--tRNA ligase n=1 Tax=Chara braunii TaxID=69332 RepID=A0A388KI63_CHABU|nr:hypothetical protein CBR_g4483 [Chara braunii]|eukprot:GBG69653.1 hypothetical protein CBR_g4483 [Chara braunii]